MDKVIYEEFKGQVNQEITLERDIAEKRYSLPSISKIGTRREERLMDEAMLRKVWILHKLLHPMMNYKPLSFC